MTITVTEQKLPIRSKPSTNGIHSDKLPVQTNGNSKHDLARDRANKSAVPAMDASYKNKQQYGKMVRSGTLKPVSLSGQAERSTTERRKIKPLGGPSSIHGLALEGLPSTLGPQASVPQKEEPEKRGNRSSSQSPFRGRVRDPPKSQPNPSTQSARSRNIFSLSKGSKSYESTVPPPLNPTLTTNAKGRSIRGFSASSAVSPDTSPNGADISQQTTSSSSHAHLPPIVKKHTSNRTFLKIPPSLKLSTTTTTTTTASASEDNHSPSSPGKDSSQLPSPPNEDATSPKAKSPRPKRGYFSFGSKASSSAAKSEVKPDAVSSTVSEPSSRNGKEASKPETIAEDSEKMSRSGSSKSSHEGENTAKNTQDAAGLSRKNSQISQSLSSAPTSGISTARVERRVQKLSLGSSGAQTLPGRLPEDMVSEAKAALASAKVFVGRPLSSERSEGLHTEAEASTSSSDTASNSKLEPRARSSSPVSRDREGSSSGDQVDREESSKSPKDKEKDKDKPTSTASSIVASISSSLDFRGRAKARREKAKSSENVEAALDDESGDSVPGTSEVRGPAVELVGLKNLGNTCFMNSALQCLRHTPQLEEILVSTDMSQFGEREICLSKHLKEMMSKMSKMAAHTSFSPSDVLGGVAEKAPFFADDEQHDCQEFLRMLLDQLHDDLNRVQVKPEYVEVKDVDGEPESERGDRLWAEYTKGNDSAIMDLFCGQLQSSVRCHVCTKVFTCYDPFWDLPVPIPKAKSSMSSGSCFRGGSTAESQCTLEECLESFTEEEVLNGDEKYYCPHCKEHQVATKWLRIVRFPRMLVVHLKRFSWTGLYTRNKISTPVQFPQFNLSLDKYMAESCSQDPCSYDLYSVANHMGGMGGGHYTATCMNPADNQWYTYNDNNVTKARSAPTNNPSAYILFYKMSENGGSVKGRV